MTAMLTLAPKWSHARGNTVVPSGWQATFRGRAWQEVVIGLRADLTSWPAAIAVLGVDGTVIRAPPRGRCTARTA